jgi:exodeoxyribonuclease VII large subunit
MSSRFPGRVYPLRGGAPRRIAETQLSLGDAGPDATAMTVSQLVERLNGVLKGGIPDVWVKGEIADLRRPGSGHLYFALKDERAAIACVMWRSTAVRLPFEAEEGLLVLARGYPDVYAPSGKLSLVVSEIQPSGVGALQLAFEQLKSRLAAEGLFDTAKKRPLPLLPRRIGVVTSRHGAALRDILKVLHARFPNAHVTLYPASVQGVAAPGEIVRAVRAFSRVKDSADVVIVARGGGSKEDLAAFNDESVVRAVAASKVPVVSAVGHEIDVTLTDLAADVRAATPSQAAEIVVERLDRFEERLARGARDLKISLKGKIDRAAHRFARLATAPSFAGFPAAVSEGRLESRAAAAALVSSFRRVPSSLLSRVARLEQSVGAWADRAAFPFLRDRVAGERRAAADRMAAHVASANEKLGVAVGRLEALSPLRVLARGYAIVNKEGEKAPVTNAADLAPGDDVRLQLARGRAAARILSTETE